MSRRGRQVSWGVVVCASVFIAGYLVKYGPVAYGTSGERVAPEVTAPPAPPTPERGYPPPSPGPAASEPAPTPSAQPAAPTQPIAGPIVIAPKPASAQPSREPSPEPPPTRPIPENAPRIKFAQTEFDFGSTFQDEKVTHEYVFENVGKSPLKIENVNTNCGCTAGKPPTGEIAPGEKSAISVTFASGRMRDRVTKHIYVTTNDPANPRTTLTITGTVKVEVDVVPTGIYFGILRAGQTVERSVVIKPVEARPFKILEVKSSDPAIHVSQPVAAGKPEPEGSYRITMTIGPLAEAKRISGNVTLRTDLAHQKEIVVTVYGRVAAAPVAAEVRQEAPSGPPAKP